MPVLHLCYDSDGRARKQKALAWRVLTRLGGLDDWPYEVLDFIFERSHLTRHLAGYKTYEFSAIMDDAAAVEFRLRWSHYRFVHELEAARQS